MGARLCLPGSYDPRDDVDDDIDEHGRRRRQQPAAARKQHPAKMPSHSRRTAVADDEDDGDPDGALLTADGAIDERALDKLLAHMMKDPSKLSEGHRMMLIADPAQSPIIAMADRCGRVATMLINRRVERDVAIGFADKMFLDVLELSKIHEAIADPAFRDVVMKSGFQIISSAVDEALKARDAADLRRQLEALVPEQPGDDDDDDDYAADARRPRSRRAIEAAPGYVRADAPQPPPPARLPTRSELLSAAPPQSQSQSQTQSQHQPPLQTQSPQQPPAPPPMQQAPMDMGAAASAIVGSVFGSGTTAAFVPIGVRTPQGYNNHHPNGAQFLMQAPGGASLSLFHAAPTRQGAPPGVVYAGGVNGGNGMNSAPANMVTGMRSVTSAADAYLSTGSDTELAMTTGHSTYPSTATGI